MSLNLYFFFKIFFILNIIFCLENSNEIQKLKLKNFDELKNNKNSLKINSDFEIIGTLTTEKLTTKNLEINGDLKITEKAKVDNMKISKLDTNFATIKKIIPSNGVLTIKGNVILTDKNIKNNNNNNNFIQIESWKLIEFNDFESMESLIGWSSKDLGKINNNNNFLGGKCILSEKEIKKTFKNLPNHNKLRIKGNFLMIGDWNDEKGYLKINNEIKWVKKGNKRDFLMNFNEKNDEKFNNVNFDVVLEHINNEVDVAFGSTLDKNSCKHSYAIDNIQVYVK